MHTVWLNEPRDFERFVHSHSVNTRVAISDLSLGSVRPHQVWNEFSRALNMVAFEPQVDPAPAHFEYASLVARGIDSEAQGAQPILSAWRRAEALLAHLATSSPIALVVVAPFDDSLFGTENVWLLKFLAERLASSASSVSVMRVVPEPVEQINSTGSDICWVIPGVVSRELERLITTNWALRVGSQLTLNPVVRRSCLEGSRRRFDALNSESQSDPWLNAFAQARGNPVFYSVPLAIETGWRAFFAGATDLAIRTLERAAAGATGRQRAELVAQLQGLRIADGRYREVAEENYNYLAAPGRLGTFLAQAQGWGFAMLRSPKQAIPPLRAALNAGTSDDLERCYLWNILALAHAMNGDATTAMELELQVESFASRAGSQPQLRYVNHLNIARLLRRAGDVELAQDRYRQAFGVFEGVKTTFDQVYEQATYARLAEELGGDPLSCWLRCALYFVSLDVPEAISRRYVAPILDREPVESGVGVVASALLDHLLRCGIPQIEPVRTLAFTASADDLGSCSAVVGNGAWTVALGHAKTLRPPRNQQVERLARFLSAHVEHGLPPEALQGADLVCVFDGFGTSMPLGRQGCASMALRLGAARYFYEGVAALLNETTRASFLAGCMLRLGPAVASIDVCAQGVVVNYVARRPARFLDGDLAAIAKSALQSTSRVKVESTTNSDFLNQVHYLERERVLKLECS